MKQNIKFGKSKKDRQEPYSENILLDTNNGLPGVLFQVGLVACNSGDSISREKILAYINKAVKFINESKKRESCMKDGNVEMILEDWNENNVKEKYFILFRCLLLHKFKEVRVAGLRLHRYLVENEKDVKSIIKCNTIPLIVRCIDLCLDNHTERLHGLRLARHLMQSAPNLFPIGLARCLVAIAREGAQTRDKLLRAAQALLCDLAILNPDIFIECGGVSCCLYGILDCSMARINEALLSGLLFLLNDPKYRPACEQFHMIAAPFSDIHYKHYDHEEEYCNNKQEERELRIKSSCLALLAALRSWPGCIILYQPQDLVLKGIIDLLLSPQESTRVVILDFLYDLMRIPLGEGYSEYETALKERLAIIPPDPDAWKLHEGFVVAEAKVLLPHIAKFRPNLIQNYFSLILYILMKLNLFSVLCTVIVSSSQNVSIKATILLGELLNLANKNIPDCGMMIHALPILSEEAAGNDADKRVKASQAITALLQLSPNKISQNENRNMSLYLSCILSNAKNLCENETVDPVLPNKDHSKATKWLGKDHDDLIQQTMRDTNVLSEGTKCSDWHWEKILPILMWPSNSLLLLDENIHISFLKRLLHYFYPSSKLFSVLPITHRTAKIQVETLLAFCEFLLCLSQDNQQKYLGSLLSDINSELMAVVCERPSHDFILSPSHLNTSMGQYYFLAIGTLTKSSIGYEMVLKATIYDQLLKVVEKSFSDIYPKLITTTLDYSIDGLNRIILTKILKNSKDCSRMYATQLLRVFIRAHAQDFAQWGIEMLVNQLYDESKLVAFAALDVLDEALDDEVYLEAVLKAPPSVQHLGDKGQLLLAKMVAFPKGFQVYQDCNFISTLLDKWANSFNLKYVKLMQVALAESLTQLQRGEDGLYGRRTGSKHIVHDVYLLPHLFGSLTLHKEGFSMLLQHKCIANLIETLREGCVTNAQKVSELKAAIWALGNLGCSKRGVEYLVSKDVISNLIQLAASCPIYSVRGTVFHVLCIIAVTWEGVNELQKYGWESVKRHHHEAVQLIFKVFTPTLKEDQLIYKGKEKGSSEMDLEDNETNRAGFYFMDEFEDEAESSLSVLLYDLDEVDTTPRKSRTLPHDTRPSYLGHQRSFSDCVPVMEELNVPSYAVPSNKDSNFSKKGYQFKTKLLSSFRRRSTKRRDSAGSRTSNSSTASEKMLSFLNPSRRRRRGRSSESSGDFVDSSEIFATLSQSLTDQCLSDDEVIIKHEEKSPKLTRSIKGNEATIIASQTNGESKKLFIKNVKDPTLWEKKTAVSNSTTLSPPKQIPNAGKYNFHKLRTLAAHRRGISESSHDELQSKNSLRDFLSSSLDQAPYNYRNLLEVRNIARSPSGCSDISSVPSFGALGPRGGSSNWLFVKSGNVAAAQQEEGPELHPSGQCYMGLSLPLDLDKLLYDSNYRGGRQSIEMHSNNPSFPVLSESEFNLKDIRKQENKLTSDANEDHAFEFHTRDICISCCSFLVHQHDENIIEAGAVSKSTGLLQNRYLVRKEILKFISNLTNPFIAKSSEAGLLALKHRLSLGFQDVCLYSEIYVLISSYSYKLTARRFIQELFLDLSFKQVFDTSKQILSSGRKLYSNVIDVKETSNSECSDIHDIPEYNLDDFAGFDMEGEY